MVISLLQKEFFTVFIVKNADFVIFNESDSAGSYSDFNWLSLRVSSFVLWG